MKSHYHTTTIPLSGEIVEQATCACFTAIGMIRCPIKDGRSRRLGIAVTDLRLLPRTRCQDAKESIFHVTPHGEHQHSRRGSCRNRGTGGLHIRLFPTMVVLPQPVNEPTAN